MPTDPTPSPFVCLNCGKPGQHFVPPSFGDPGAFTCACWGSTRMSGNPTDPTPSPAPTVPAPDIATAISTVGVTTMLPASPLQIDTACGTCGKPLLGLHLCTPAPDGDAAILRQWARYLDTNGYAMDGEGSRYAVAHCLRIADRLDVLTGDLATARAERDAAKAEAQAARGRWGHRDGPCDYCGTETNSLAASPSKWNMAFPRRDGTGVCRPHHTGCVLDRLARCEQAEAALAQAVTERDAARTSNLGYIERALEAEATA